MHNSQHSNYRSREYRTFIRGLVIEAYITTCNGCIELGTGFTYPFNCFYKLPVNLRVIWITKVEAVSYGGWFSTGAGYITGSFRNGYRSTLFWVGINVTGIAIYLKG